MVKVRLAHPTRLEIQRAVASDVGHCKMSRVWIIIDTRSLRRVGFPGHSCDLSAILCGPYRSQLRLPGRFGMHPIITSNANGRS